MIHRTLLLVALVSAAAAQGEEWEPAEPRLSTRWTEQVSPVRVHPEYPRPRLRRADWENLNGLWEYAVRPRTDGRPAEWDGAILVPFPIESSLSGVARRVTPDERLWYRTAFAVPADWSGRRVVLRFGAVDWRADVWVDGRKAGEHEGGYDPFALDVTGLLAPAAEHELVVAVWDPTDAGYQPRGKQVRDPHGIWYTPTTGIWQTVWLEPLPHTAIEGVRVEEAEPGELSIVADVPGGTADLELEATVSFDGSTLAVGRHRGPRVEVPLGDPRRWSPDDPALYQLRLRLLDGDEVVDEVESYCALRTVEVRPDEAGTPRIHLNGSPLFQLGLLDQGFWPDGLYTAPTDEALRYDLEVTRRLGFNLVRKHVKVEPERWYHHCDVLGLLVWQDLPSGGPYIGPADPDAERGANSAASFEREAARLVDALRHYPCIVSWVLFNEGWGQYDTERLTSWLAAYDPTRLVNSASGWTDRGVGHVHDIHRYPGPAIPPVRPPRAAVLGEFGGLGLPVAGHTWQDEENWGYRSFETREELVEAYLGLMRDLRPLVAHGLSAAVYTQTTDVEIEVNGLMTYDRAILKLDDPRVVDANRRLYLPPPTIESLVETSRDLGREWRFTLAEPPAGWEARDHDDSGWARGLGGFGTADTPGAVVGTTWSEPAIWLRRTFELPTVPRDGELCLEIHHDEDAVVYLNGARIAELPGYTTSYALVPLSEEVRGLLAAGRNTLAVHCRQTGGGQFIDLGLCVLRERQ